MMQFLTPWVAAGLAAIVVPLLVLLYFLKLRRREQPIASTLLWKQAVEDLQVNAPFQRLRRNLLLLLQLLVLAAALFALARPMIETQAAQESSLVLLIDRSASMNTREPDGRTRLEVAKEQATRLVRSLNQTGSRWFSLTGAPQSTRVMVIGFGDRATVISPFTTNTADLVAAIEEIEATDGMSHLGEAFTLAEAYLEQTTVDVPAQFAQTGRASKLMLYSDGRIDDLQSLALRHGEVEQITIGEQQDNAGITALRVRRNYERPEEVEVFLQVQNFGAEAISSDVALYVDGVLRAVETVTLSPGLEVTDESAAAGDVRPTSVTRLTPEGSQRALSLPFALDRAGVVEVRLAREDALPIDNRAYATVPAPRRLRVLVVGEENFFLKSVLSGLPLGEVEYNSPTQYASRPDDELAADGQSLYDVVIFDGYDAQFVPAGNYLCLGAVPDFAGVTSDGTIENLSVVWWDETHPILRHVALEYVYVAEALDLQLPDTAEVLAESEETPLLARVSSEGRQLLYIPFQLQRSNWVFKPSFTVFFYNALRYLGSAGAADGGAGYRPGDTLAIQLPANVAETTLVRPDGREVPLRPNAAGIAYYGGTNQVGLYEVREGLAGRDKYAVNLLDVNESAIPPQDIAAIGTKEVVRGEKIQAATPEIWRWFVGGALVLLLLEWYVYNRRVMI